MVGSLNVAERRLKSLIGTYGYETVIRATEDLIGIAERRMSEEIRRIPRRRVPLQRHHRGRRRIGGVVRGRLHRRGGRRRRDLRLHRIVRPGRRAHERHLRRHRPRRSTTPSCTSPIPRSRATRAATRPINVIAPAGHHRELRVPGAAGGRQHRAQPPHHRHHLRRPWPAPCPSASRPATAAPSAASCSGAGTPRPASCTRTSTSRASAGAGAPSATATAR